jgi:hypothetical protein
MDPILLLALILGCPIALILVIKRDLRRHPPKVARGWWPD